MSGPEPDPQGRIGKQETIVEASNRAPEGATFSRRVPSSRDRPRRPSPVAPRSMIRPLVLALLFLAASTLVALWAGYRLLDLSLLREDPMARTLFFELRLPRVVLGGILGASLGAVGACLQAFFRNPLAEPFTLGVSGGGTLGASVAIALGWGVTLLGLPMVFLAAIAGSAAAVLVVYRLSRTGEVVMPGTLLLAGVVVNLIASAGVILVQYIADYSRALQILRWTIGTIDIVGFDRIWRMLILLIPGWVVLLVIARDLHLLAMGEESAASLGVNVRRCERLVFAASSLIVGVAVAEGGTIAFVGLIIPHAVRLLFGQDVRVVLPCSFLVGAGFLMLADAVARTALTSGELPVGAVTAVIGGITFLGLLRRQRRFSAI